MIGKLSRRLYVASRICDWEVVKEAEYGKQVCDWEVVKEVVCGTEVERLESAQTLSKCGTVLLWHSLLNGGCFYLYLSRTRRFDCYSKLPCS